MDEQTTSTSGNSSPFFVTGGTLALDAPSYVERDADRQLLDALDNRQFAAVLDTRQIGKSSLMVRAANALKDRGTRVALLDLTRLGQPATPEQWYYGLLLDLGQQIGLRSELRAYWQENKEIGPLQRWVDALRAVALPASDAPLVVFIDEIDAVLNLPFSADAFFAALRECYTRRASDRAFWKLTFCLLGSATPDTLMRDVRTTPFNIGVRVEPTDFTEAEALAFAPVLSAGGRDGKKLFKRVLYWTGGHPYLTQRLCQAVAEDASVTNADGVDRVCDALFLSASARERESNLTFVGRRLLRGTEDRTGVLDLYGRVRARGLGLVSGIKDDATDPLCQALRLAGVVRVVEGYLWVRNRIYFRVFDAEWVRANLPDAEVKRQRAAFRRGVLRSLAGFGVIAALLAALAWTALRERNAADANASKAKTAKLASDRNAARADQNAHEAEASARTAREQTQLAQRRERERSAALAQALQEKNLATQNARIAQLAGQDAKVKAEEANQNAALARSEKVQAEQNAETAEEQAASARELAYDADMNLAQRYYETGETSQCNAILASYLPRPGQHDCRGIEWRYWYKMCHMQSNSRTFAKIRNVVDLSHDASNILLERDSPETGYEVTTPKGLVSIGTPLLFKQVDMGHWKAFFTEDDKHVVLENSTSGHLRIAVYGTRTGQELCRSSLEGRFSGEVYFSPDARQIVGIKNGRPEVLDSVTGKFVCELAMPDSASLNGANYFTFSAQGDEVYGQFHAQDNLSTIGVWDAQTGTLKYTIPTYANGDTNNVMFSPDQEYMVASTNAGEVVVYQRRRDETWVECWENLNDSLHGGSISNDSTKCAFYDYLSQIKVYDLSTGNVITTIPGTEGEIQRFSPNDKDIVGDHGETWRIDNTTVLTVLPRRYPGSIPTISPDRRYYFWYFGEHEPTASGVVNQGDNGLFGLVQNRVTGRLSRIPPPRNMMFSTQGGGYAAFSGNGRTIATGCPDGSLCIIDVGQSKIVSVLKATDSGVVKVAVSRDGRDVAVAHQNGVIEVWDVTKSMCTYRCKSEQIIASSAPKNFVLALSSDGTKVAYEKYKTLTVYDIRTDKELFASPQDYIDYNQCSSFTDCQFFDNDKSLFIYVNPSASIINLEREQERKLPSFPIYPTGGAVSNSGNRIILSDYTGKSNIFDTATNRETLAIQNIGSNIAGDEARIAIDDNGFTVASEASGYICDLPAPADTQQVQSAVADTQSTFETVPPNAAQSALGARDAKDALTRLDQTGTFVGTVQQVVTTPDHTWTTLVFANDKAALTARLYAGSYTVFPRLDRLKGKRIVVTGRFDLENGKVHVELVEPTQIQIVAGK